MMAFIREKTGLPRALAPLCVALAIGGAGCVMPPPESAVSPLPVTSFDGRYEGAIQVSGAATSLDPRECAVPTRMAVDVRDNRFSYVLAHPALLATPTLARNPAPTYVGTILQDGMIRGISDVNTVLIGRAGDGRIAGEIFGLLCYYRFTLTRV